MQLSGIALAKNTLGSGLHSLLKNSSPTAHYDFLMLECATSLEGRASNTFESRGGFLKVAQSNGRGRSEGVDQDH